MTTTTTVPDSLFKKLKAINALVIHVDTPAAEREQARRTLERLLAANHLVLADLDLDAQKSRWDFRYRFAEEKDIVMQLIAVIRNSNSVSFYTYAKKKKVLGFDLTRAEQVQAEMLIPYYIKAYRRSLKNYASAFIAANRLYPETSPNSNKPLTPEELKNLHEIAEMASGIVPVSSPRLQLKGG